MYEGVHADVVCTNRFDESSDLSTTCLGKAKMTRENMSKSFYLRCNTLHALPNFVSNTQRKQVRNGQYVGVLFVMPVIVDIHGHRFEIFTLVSEIHENVDLVLGIKNILN